MKRQKRHTHSVRVCRRKERGATVILLASIYVKLKTVEARHRAVVGIPHVHVADTASERTTDTPCSMTSTRMRYIDLEARAALLCPANSKVPFTFSP